MMNPTAIIKCRRLLGNLTGYGLQASRGTRTQLSPLGFPDALLTADDGRAWVVALWGGNSLEPSLLPTEEEAPSLEHMITSLEAWRRDRQGSADDPCPAILVLAPALADQALPNGHWQGVGVIRASSCKKAALLAQGILDQPTSTLGPDALARWRLEVVPEVRIDSPWQRRKLVRTTPALAAPLLLDYKQERCARLDLEPDAEVVAILQDLRLRVVTGVAGCGKTLLLVHRAALLAAHFPQARVLLVSFNRPLISDLRRRVQRLGAGGRIICRTFNQWLASVMPMPEHFLTSTETKSWIERERKAGAYDALAKCTTAWIHDELTWMCDHEYADETYLRAERKGRGSGISARQRREMLGLLRRYREYLGEAQRGDWSEWPLRVLETDPGAAMQDRFDHLLIDEAQFFAPVWLKLLRGTLKAGGHLFLCADPTQGFLRRRTSWASLGLEVHGRTIRLEKPYRSTRAIMEFARAFYLHRVPADEEPLNLPAPEWMETLEPGTPPIIQPAGPGQEQWARLEKELASLREAGISLGEVMILVAGRTQSPDRIVLHLNRKLGADTAVLMKEAAVSSDCVGVSHLMAAAGLERPIVFLLGGDDLAAVEQDPTLDEEELARLSLDHTRQIYVGLTRAMERLVIYSSDPSLRRAFGVPPS